MDMVSYLRKYSVDHSTLQVVGPLYQAIQSPTALTEPVVFVDGGANFRKANLGFSVGDGDSTTQKLDLLLNPEKNVSDLGFVFQEILEAAIHFRKIELHGFLGGRRDHELMNLAEAHRFLGRVGSPTQLHFDSDIFVTSGGDWHCEIHGPFSFFSFAESELKLSGDCKYKTTQNLPLQNLSSQGLSNEGFGLVRWSCKTPVFLFRLDSKCGEIISN